jgi:hypothetical protein
MEPTPMDRVRTFVKELPPFKEDPDPSPISDVLFLIALLATFLILF